MMDGPELYEDIFPFDSPPRIVGVRGEVALTDTTLRDGQQGWRYLSLEEGLKIYEILAELGGEGAILTTEVFLYTDKDRELARRIMDLGYRYPEPIAWIRATRSDLGLVLESGLGAATILASISDYHIYFKLGVDRDIAFRKYLEVVEEALRHGIRVKVTLEDVTRADLEKNVRPFVESIMRLEERYGAEIIIKLADTLGVGLPFPEVPPPRGVPALIRYLIDVVGFPGSRLEFHSHNDLGLVVANHLAAWYYGAALSNCTLFGIGERAGNCPLEVMLIHYAGIMGRENRANLRAIRKAVQLFRELGLNIPEFHPLVGENAFRTKAGIHVDGLIKNPRVYLPFDPYEVLGIPYSVAINPYSGRAAIALWLSYRLREGNGRDISRLKNDPRVMAIYNEILDIFRRGRALPMTDAEMMEIASKYFPELQGV